MLLYYGMRALAITAIVSVAVIMVFGLLTPVLLQQAEALGGSGQGQLKLHCFNHVAPPVTGEAPPVIGECIFINCIDERSGLAGEPHFRDRNGDGVHDNGLPDHDIDEPLLCIKSPPPRV